MGFLSSILKVGGAALGNAILPGIGGSIGGALGSAAGGALSSSKASKAANAAYSSAQMSGAQIQQLIDQMTGYTGKLSDDADYNRKEGDQLMEGFYKAIQDQIKNQDYIRGRNATNDALALDARDYERGYDANNADLVAREYATRYSQLLDDRRAQENERLTDLQNKDRIRANTQAMRDAISRTLETVGQLSAPTLYGKADVDAESGRRMGVYSSAMDKIRDKQLSLSEAGLIKRGVDYPGSADSNEVRADVAARLADAYAQAQLRSDTEAQGIIDGRNKTLTDAYSLAKDQRERTLSEATAPYSAGLELEAALNPAVSGIISRDIGSAGYRGTATSGINSAFVDPGYLDARTFGSLASNSRTRASQDYGQALEGLSRALAGSSQKYGTDMGYAKDLGVAAGKANSENDAQWGNLIDLWTNRTGKTPTATRDDSWSPGTSFTDWTKTSW